MDVRDRDLLLLALASGGRRRSELAALRIQDVTDPVRADQDTLSSPSLSPGRTKTTTNDDDEQRS